MSSPHDPLRRQRAALSSILAEDELPEDYYLRAVAELMNDVREQRDFVASEFLDREAIRCMIVGTRKPNEVAFDIRLTFGAWLREHRKFRVTTMAWALYERDRLERNNDRRP